MKSLSVQKVSRFDFTDSVSFPDSSGSIALAGNTLTISNDILQPFTCTYNITVNEDILVKDMETGKFVPTDEYKKSTTFPAFYDQTKGILFLMAPSIISKGFMKELINSYGPKLATSGVYDFDFTKISRFEVRASGIYFNVDDDTDVDTKHFFGSGVQDNDEVIDAIDKDNATYLMAKIDVDGEQRTIGFSKKGTLVIYSKLNDDGVEQPYLQLAIDTLIAISQQ
ncbi:hypothetical protein [Lentilactobacillus hilgardii]|uniref:Uncharacterized protein n=1 Tax=Lentilactobacillus hilgardii (strain ATCC 8290 / DSM 20176 / CCUG 30140 / JCM 1155 / KCTC 3500 / NBRC 15886 / NCIMB 8040 / NRRL B-1843 / 9) TaxID=1423757 RepID=C0XFJ5_LENH9|nr:hypothetical protein [Lentilactobacillus hilgardii]EEI25816.1 hypothetical protein HMPREF0519_0006 [Lentilactobacillus hilgardii DSM 20176 = ATCC 8290]QEU39068.1 hypothetical protein LH500_09325 [Lentilactobacillus hilgardii]TDG82328.1 hypothetical protein C5L34_002423 [Lentilactobacillus hilgardii]